MPNRFEKYAQRDASHHGPGVSQGMEPPTGYVPGDSTPFTEAFGGGMVRGARGLGNLLMKSANNRMRLPPNTGMDDMPFFGNNAIRAQNELDKPLSKQPGAGIGGFLGEVVATPAMAPEGALTKAGGVLAKSLGQRAVARGAEGAVASAQYADPNSAGEAGAAGGLLSMALGRMGDAGGRLARGMVKKSDAAQHLEHLAGQHGEEMQLPLSLSADPNDPTSAFVGGVYRNVTPLIPFASNRLESQRDKARQQLRQMVYKEASPTGLNLTPDEMANSDKALGKISKEFIKQYDDTVKSYAFNVPSDFAQQLESRVKGGRPNIDKTTLGKTTQEVQDIIDRFSDGSGVIQGDNLLFARKELGDLIRTGKTHEKDTYKAAVKWIDDHIVSELSQGNSKTNKADLQKYLELSEPWKAKVATEKAAGRAFLGEFGPEDLYRTSRPGTSTREIARAGAEVLKPKATRQSLEGKILGGAILGGVGHFMGLGPALALTAGGHVLANPSTQKALTGDYAVQKWLNSRLPESKTRALTSALRRGAAAETGEEYDE